MNDIIEDEVLFERTDEYLMIVDTSLAALNQANILNISLLTKKITEAESTKKKFQDKITRLRTKIKKRKKVDALGRTRYFSWFQSWMFCRGTKDSIYNKGFKKESQECISNQS